MSEIDKNTASLPEKSNQLEQVNQIQQNEQQQQQSSSADWTSGIDVIGLASDVIETVGDALSNIVLSF
jgi:hypothetical protein